MKKLIMLFVALLFVANSYSQIEVSTESWSSGTDEEHKAALVTGVSISVGSPMLFVQKTGDENIQIHLVYWPGVARCKTSKIVITFDGVEINTTATYQYTAYYSNLPFDTPRYIINFSATEFIEKLVSCQTLRLKLTNECGIDIKADYTLEGVSEALEILN